ncbi:Aste57867_8081 [Aphanomyces stellatus]|uniref:Aste57867_8081 protein n=1 Tax=Aphanomyces stellatus TaxID=120398 RepID=A0A485KJD2_9STRA|nr:hypothetical protein As57867_008051 [Aphanomyces stellatus]VFT84970.1 Aste57867_8081 [Aphanomyces stellatus]
MKSTSRLSGVLVCNIALPLSIYAIASQYTTNIVAMGLYSIPPSLKAMYELVALHVVDWISAFQLAITGLSLLFMMYVDDPRIALLKDVVVPMACAFASISSLVFPRFNLLWKVFRLWYFASVAENARLDALWDGVDDASVAVRRQFTFLAVVSGLVVLVEDSVRVYLIATAPFSTMVFVSPLVGIATAVCILLCVTWNIRNMAGLFPPTTSAVESTPLLP